jgi:glutamine synthetase
MPARVRFSDNVVDGRPARPYTGPRTSRPARRPAGEGKGAVPIAGNAEHVFRLIKEKDIQFVDLKLVDLPGTWQHMTVPVAAFDEGAFRDGVGFDGSSIRGFQKINESDMLLRPDPETAFVDPASKVPTLSLICDVYDPVTGEAYSRDPRNVARKAEAYLRQSGIADQAFFGPEIEFFLFSDVRYGAAANGCFYSVDSPEGIWNTGHEEPGGNLGYKIRHKEGYFPVPPSDTLLDVRNEMVQRLAEVGVPVEVHHHEVATAGQCEIDMRFSTLVQMADNCMKYKHVIRNVARAFGLTAVFMPKPLYGDNGSGMHVHQSLWKDGKPLFYEAGQYAGLSELARHYIGGLIAHAPALLAFCAPTTNSYKRLVPGFEAPVNLVYSQRNRSACIRIPMYSDNPKAKRIEFRCPDPSANPYLAFAALLMAGLDGIRRRIEPPAPIDADLYELPASELAKIQTVPGSLGEALAALERDHDFLLEGGVFTADLIEAHIEYKRTRELQPVNMRPHPYEFYLYSDV